MNNYNLTQEQLNDIAQIYENLKDIARAVYISGSVSLGFIPNNHDIDIILMFDSREQMNEYHSKLKNDSDFKELIRHSKTLGIALISNVLNDTLNQVYTKPWMYVRHFMKPLYGEDLHIDFNIQENYQTLLTILKEYLPKLSSTSKRLYYVLTSIYILQNNSFDFTEEQIENINIAHDQQDEVRVKELYDYCVEWLNNN